MACCVVKVVLGQVSLTNFTICNSVAPIAPLVATWHSSVLHRPILKRSNLPMCHILVYPKFVCDWETSFVPFDTQSCALPAHLPNVKIKFYVPVIGFSFSGMYLPLKPQILQKPNFIVTFLVRCIFPC